jgi:multiple sugar transport system substrate-binding protein
MRFGFVLSLVFRGIAVAGVGCWLFVDTFGLRAVSSSDEVVIRFAHFGTYQDFELWSAVIDAFDEAHPGVDVAQEYVAGWYGHYETKLRQQMVAGSTPHVAMMQIGPLQHLAAGFAHVPDAEWVRALDESGVGACLVGGRLKGVPVSGGNLLIYLNPRCFERAGIEVPSDDWTIDEFRATAEALTRDFDEDEVIDQFGFWQPGWIYYLPFLWSFGGRMVDDAGGRWLLTDDAAEDAVGFYQGMRMGGAGFGRRVCPQPEETAQMIQDVGFLTGRTAMCVNGPWFQPFLAETSLAEVYEVRDIPSGPGGRWTRMTWDAVCVAEGLEGAEADAAWRFVEFVCSVDGQRMIAGAGRALPSLEEARDSVGSRFGRQFSAAASYSRMQPLYPGFSEVDRAMRRRLGDLLDLKKPCTPREFLESMSGDPVVVEHFEVDGR